MNELSAPAPLAPGHDLDAFSCVIIVPVVIIDRLAVDRVWQGKGIGGDLLYDAVLRTLGAADTIGVRAILVHAVTDGAKRFYEKYGFSASQIEPLTLMLTIAQARATWDNVIFPSRRRRP